MLDGHVVLKLRTLTTSEKRNTYIPVLQINFVFSLFQKYGGAWSTVRTAV